MSRVIVPVDLGGSATPCRVSPPRRPSPDPDTIRALIGHYERERLKEGDHVEVSFFHGGLPTPEQLAAAAPHPVRVSCSPADLSRADAVRLIEGGVQLIELEVLTFDDRVLRDLHRGYTAGQVDQMRAGLAAAGLGVGVVLMPGLPGSSHGSALDDAARCLGSDRAPAATHVRLYPALALQGSGLAAELENGRWRPMRLGEAVTTLTAVMDILEPAVPVARVGLQLGQDLPARLVAGPSHPNLRQLVEARRFRRRFAEALAGVAPGCRVALRVNPKDLSLAMGISRQNLRDARLDLGLESLDLQADERVARGRVEVA